ncbi:MAG: acyl-CoA thioester hydrolase [Frankiales bacterium]|nr:acyl-CoA thioester hydrolase [Frankiales bacterium]
MPLSQTIPVQVRFADLDPLNHVNNVAFFSLMETARVEFLRGQAKSLFGHMVIAHSECDYLNEIRGGTRTVDVTISIEKVGNTSFTVLHELLVGDVVVGRGRTVQVALDDQRKPRPLTDDERTLLLAD